MSWISEDDIKAIRQQADIVDVMSRYITLEKKAKIIKLYVLFMMIMILAYPFLQINKYSNVSYVVQEGMSLLLYKKLKTFPFWKPFVR